MSEEKIQRVLDRLIELANQESECPCHSDTCFATLGTPCCAHATYVSIGGVRTLFANVVKENEEEIRRLKVQMRERHNDYAKTLAEMAFMLVNLQNRLEDQLISKEYDMMTEHQLIEQEKEHGN